jgi:hypothetical protein
MAAILWSAVRITALAFVFAPRRLAKKEKALKRRFSPHSKDVLECGENHRFGFRFCTA